MDMDAAIDLLAQGAMLKEIAAQYGVSKQAVHKRLSTHPRYKQALKEQAAALVHKAMEETQNVCLPDNDEAKQRVSLVDIARVRELRAAAFRYAESVSPEDWGQKAHVSADLSISVTIARAVEQPLDVVDADVVQSQQDSGITPSLPHGVP